MDAILKCLKLEPLNKKAHEYKKMLENEKQPVKPKESAPDLAKRFMQSEGKEGFKEQGLEKGLKKVKKVKK